MPRKYINKTAPEENIINQDEIEVSVKGLKKSYGNVQAVKGVDFHIAKGEIYGFLGPNGAGKTTTISMISTYLKPDSGDAFVNGKSAVGEPFEVKKMIGVSPQEVALYEDLSAEQNLAFFGRMHGLSRGDISRRAGELLEFTGLTEKRKKPVSTYSGGMKRRLNMACGLINNPRFLMLDEPTAGVDPQAREYIYDMIANLKKTGTTILYTTHYMEEAQDLCDRIGIIDLGEIIAEGTLEELLDLVRGKD
ncbi:MAG: ATP-binding cassette domain-containing protein, partial [Actinobacteria bacterium]|nr:ATP-binding cassette domain-containing protein [Actinomycetota bacterium]